MVQNTFDSKGQTKNLVPASGSGDLQHISLSRGMQRQVDRNLDRLSAEVVVQANRQRSDAALEHQRMQLQYELNVVQEQNNADLAMLHEHGRGLIANTAIQEVTATGALADSISKAYPIVAPQVWKIVDAQATGSAMTVLRY